MPTATFPTNPMCILPILSLLPILALLAQNAEGYGGMRFQVDGWEQEERRPSQWRLRQWRPVDISGRPPRFLQRQTRSIGGGIISQPIPPPPTSSADEWAPLFGDSSSASALLKKLGQEDDEPLVISRYNRDCFFTPINCFVGRAGQQATNIVGSASNSKRQILFIKRRHRNNQRNHRKTKKSGGAGFL